MKFKYKSCFLVLALLATTAIARAAAECPTITLQQEEIAEIMSAQETYAYFGPAMCSLISDLPALTKMARASGMNAKHLDALCELVSQGYTTAPATMVKAAVEEAAACVAACKAELAAEELTRIADALEQYDHALQSGAADLVIADEEEAGAEAQTRGTKKFDNIIVRNRAAIGSLFVGGDETVHHNLTVDNDLLVKGNEIINGTLTVRGATIFSGTSTTISGDLKVLRNIKLPDALPGSAVQGILQLGVDPIYAFNMGTSNFFAGDYTSGMPSTITTGSHNISIGTRANIGLTTGINSIAIGTNSAANASGAVAVGNLSRASAAGALALGLSAVSSQASGIVLGDSTNTAVAVGIGTNTPGAKLHVINGGATPAIIANAIAGQNSVEASAGTIAAPAYSFIGNTNAGIYSPAANQVAVTTNSLQRVLIDNNGDVTVVAPTTGVALTVNGAAVAATNAEVINQSNSSTTGSALSLVGAATPTGAPLTISAGGAQNSITTSTGTVALPAYSFTGNTNTGIYSPGTNQVALSGNGTQRLLMDATGSIQQFSTYKLQAGNAPTPLSFATLSPVVFGTNNNPSGSVITGDGGWTVPVSGYYWVTANVTGLAGGAAPAVRAIAISLDSTTTPYTAAGSATFSIATVTNGLSFSLSTQTLVQATAGQLVRTLYNNSGESDANLDIYMSIHYASMNP